MLRKCLVFMLLINATLVSAGNDPVFKYRVNKPMSQVYADVYKIIAAASPAKPLIETIESEVIAAIQQAMDANNK